MGALFVVLVVIAVAAVAVWNLVPAVRDKVKGWTTILEASMGSFIYFFGEITGGLQEALNAGLVPKWLLPIIPFLLFMWVILKRFQTKTPVGAAKK